MYISREFFVGAFTETGYIFLDPMTLLIRDVGVTDDRKPTRYVVRGGSRTLRAKCMSRIAARLSEADIQIDVMASALDPNIIQAVLAPRLGIAAILDDDCSLAPLTWREDDSTLAIELDDALKSDRPLLLPWDDDYDTDLIPQLRNESLSNERRACQLLKAAAALQNDAEEEWRDQVIENELQRLLAPWLGAVTAFRDEVGGGREASFFAEAVTSKGIVKHLDTIEMPRQWRIAGPWGADVSTPLRTLRDAALSRGLSVLTGVNIIRPDRISHLLIPDIGLFVTSEDDPGELAAPAQRSIDLRNVMPTHEVLSQSTLRAIAFDEMMYNDLVERAAYCLELSKKARERIDAHQHSRVDDEKAERVISAAVGKIDVT